MSLRISNIRLPADQSEATLPDHLARRLSVRREDICRLRILRKSLDLRDKSAITFVYALEVEMMSGCSIPARISEFRIEEYAEPGFHVPAAGPRILDHRPIIVGTGPAGLLCGWLLADLGYRPLLLERGRAVRDRLHDVRAFDQGGPLDAESNYLFGEGGAGTFSDGKLTCRASGPDVKRVLQLFAENKGKPSILYDCRPHLGSNRLPAIVKALRRRIQAAGGEVRFSCRMEDLHLVDGQVRGVATSSGFIPAAVVVLAVGHSARDTYTMLRRRGVPFLPKPFQLGVRIEQPQDSINRFQYGRQHWEETLGAADYSVIAHGPADIFSFCMCAGGHIIPSVSAPGFFSTNGMSLSGRDSPFANSGLMMTLTPQMFGGEDVFSGIELQKRFEQRAFEIGRREYRCPVQTAADFLDRRATTQLPPCSYPRGLVLADIAELVPPAVVAGLARALPAINQRWRGRFLNGAILAAPEARGSSPVRIPRDLITMQTPGINGLYPVGEGAGYAGGIISAAADGLRAAKAVVAAYQPLDPAGGSSASLANA